MEARLLAAAQDAQVKGSHSIVCSVFVLLAEDLNVVAWEEISVAISGVINITYQIK